MRVPPPIPIYENYGAYKPRIEARKIIENLLSSIDPDYLRGLGSIVLSSQRDLSRVGRRKKFLSRGRKIPSLDVLAYYGPHYRGNPAFIEIYVDRILAFYPALFLQLPMMGFILIGKIFFHELGHHLHNTSHPEFKEKEDVADEWSKKLMKSAFLRRYRYAVPILRPIYKAIVFAARKIAPVARRSPREK
jgi:hypothetical protein